MDQIAVLPPLPEISFDGFENTGDVFGTTVEFPAQGGIRPCSLRTTEFTDKNLGTRIGQISTILNKWKKLFVTGFVEKKHKAIIPSSNQLKLQRHVLLHCESAMADFIETYNQ
jgi:hypothetical protein